jgi:hypothetical protein
MCSQRQGSKSTGRVVPFIVRRMPVYLAFFWEHEEEEEEENSRE